MSRIHYQSLLFAFLVLGFAMIHKEEAGSEAFRHQEELTLYQPTFAANDDTREFSANVIPAVPEGRKTVAVADPIPLFRPEQAPKNVTVPTVNAQAVFARDLGGPYIYVARESDVVWPIASLTKLMTAVVAKETFDPQTLITVSETAVATEGLSGDLVVEDIYSLSDMIATMLIISSNDAAYALAEHGNVDLFVSYMNAKAKELGMNQTTYTDPTGLSPLNTSTPEDLEKLISYIYIQHPEIFNITRQPSISVRELTQGKERTIANNNAFGGRRDFLGGKTGYLDESGGNLISLFEFNNKRYLIILFGSNSRFSDTEKIYNAIRNI